MITGFNASAGKTAGAKHAGMIYQEIQHDNGDRYVVRSKYLLFRFTFIQMF